MNHLAVLHSRKFLVMSRLALAVALVSFCGLLKAQESEVRNIGSFRGIKASSGIDVYLKKGDKESVRVVVGGSTRFTNIVTEISGTYLDVHIRDGRNIRNVNAKVYVTYVTLNKIYARSAANVYSEEDVKVNNLEIGSSSAASIELNVEVDELELNVSAAGNVELEGKARKAVFEVSSAGEIDAYNLEVEILNVEAVTAGSAKVNVTRELEAKASSGGSIRFRGNPSRSRTDSTSGGSVKKSY